MILTPRYDGPVILAIEGALDDQLAPVVRQRRRMETMLTDLTDDQWATPSRCDGWTVRDVAAHLIGVNSFWHGSITAGLAGNPTRFLAAFDPAATPPAMVAGMSALAPGEVLQQFIASNDSFLGVIEGLDDEGWATLAESPPGHVAIRLVAQHALWDAWVHERDIALPLSLVSAVEDDEVRSCLCYAAAISPTLALGWGREVAGTFAVEATGPDQSFVVEVGQSVALRYGPPDSGTPCLRGDAVALIEALSIRTPMPPSTPPEWTTLLAGLATAFDTAAD